MSKIKLNNSRYAQKERFWVKDETDEIDYDSSKQAFEILPFNPKAVDLNKVPSSAQEYLEQVITERLILPKVVSGEMPYEKNESNHEKRALGNTYEQTVRTTEDEKNKPAIEWVKEEIVKFNRLRTFVEKMSHSFKYSYSPEWPPRNNKKAWLKYLYSIDTDDDDTDESESDNDLSDNDDDNNDFDYIDYEGKNGDCIPNGSGIADNAKLCNRVGNHDFKPTMPLLTTILTMDETVKEVLIDYIAGWIRDGILTVYSGSVWLYALFACIMLPASPNVISSARVVAKTAIRLRRNMDQKKPTHKSEIIAQNLMICIISKFLGQYDLADYSIVQTL